MEGEVTLFHSGFFNVKRWWMLTRADWQIFVNFFKHITDLRFRVMQFQKNVILCPKVRTVSRVQAY